MRAPIQFRKESQPHHFKRWFLPQEQTFHFHINSTSLIKPFEQNQLSFPSSEINNPLPAPVQCLADQSQVQKPIQVVAQIRCLITFRIESSIIGIDSNITDNIIRKVINPLSAKFTKWLNTLKHPLLRKEDIRPYIWHEIP